MPGGSMHKTGHKTGLFSEATKNNILCLLTKNQIISASLNKNFKNDPSHAS
jgi:hypothetical protein